MKGWIGGLVLGMVLGSAVAGAAQSFSGLLRGDEWKTYSVSVQGAYVMGVLDGLGLTDYALKMGDSKSWDRAVSRDIKCLIDRRISVGQVLDTATKWVSDHPEKQDFRMSLVIIGAVQKICP